MTDTKETSKFLLSGNEAVALAAEHAGVALGTGYPGTPSTEILENFSANGGRAQWAPNEKVALEVGLGAAYAGARALVTMKHVGVNVAADPLFTAAYTGVSGGLILISADDPGMAFSQNEQDNRNYAKAAGIPMFEPSDSQEAYAFTLEAFELSERWHLPIMLRLTTRVCHSKTVVQSNGNAKPAEAVSFERDIPGRVMIPAYARPAHKRLRERLAEIETWNENSGLNRRIGDSTKLGIVASGIAAMHAYEAAPGASVLKLGVTYPLPMGLIRDFVKSVDRCVVVEEGDPYLTEAIRAEGLAVESKADLYRFGVLRVCRIRILVAQDTTPVAPPPKGKAPPSSARAARTATSSPFSPNSTASSPATSAATHWGSCRRFRPWTPASAWVPASASAWVYGMSCPRSRRGESSASSATAPLFTVESPAWWRWFTTRPKPAMSC